MLHAIAQGRHHHASSIHLLLACLLGCVCQLAVLAAPQGKARVDMWIRSQLPTSARAVGPEVHSVKVDETYVTVTSAGLSMQSFGPLESRPYDGAKGIRQFSYKIPRHPVPAAKPMPVPFGVIGAFRNGVPLYNLANVASYRDQNLWHVDVIAQRKEASSPLLQALLTQTSKHSPLLGFALDGYPIYGPFGWDAQKNVRRFRSSYQLRATATRDKLPTGDLLTPAQEGPPANAEFPMGTFLEDYEFAQGSGDLDQHNGRFAKTPEFPDGTYAYFLATREDGTMAYPYLIGPTYQGTCDQESSKDWKPLSKANGLQLLGKDAVWRAGEPISFALASSFPVLERVHEKEMHVLVISENLALFAHIHPDAQQRNFFTGTHTFPHAGNYWIYVDHTPPGQTQTIAKFRVKVAGPTHLPVPFGNSQVRQASAAGLQATLATQGPLTAGSDIAFQFRLADVATGEPVTDLQPYLGAWGHILLVRQQGDEVIHAHPVEADAPPTSPWVHSHALPGPSPSTIETVTGFKLPGVYKVWLQVQRNGAVLTFPFSLRIQPAPPITSASPSYANVQRITVSANGFQPARLVLPANQPIRLVFHRVDAQNCAGRVVFPELQIDRVLPQGADVLVILPPQAAKQISFHCGMRMYRGTMLVR